jgi:transaldolase
VPAAFPAAPWTSFAAAADIIRVSQQFNVGTVRVATSNPSIFFKRGS